MLILKEKFRFYFLMSTYEKINIKPLKTDRIDKSRENLMLLLVIVRQFKD